jgi:hypothetical protein
MQPSFFKSVPRLGIFVLLVAQVALGGLPVFEEEPLAAEAVSGTVVERTPDRLVIRDAEGHERRLLLTAATRVIWGETASLSDFRLGAHVRALYARQAEGARALEVWVLSPPTARPSSRPGDTARGG